MKEDLTVESLFNQLLLREYGRVLNQDLKSGDDFARPRSEGVALGSHAETLLLAAAHCCGLDAAPGRLKSEEKLALLIDTFLGLEDVGAGSALFGSSERAQQILQSAQAHFQPTTTMLPAEFRRGELHHALLQNLYALFMAGFETPDALRALRRDLCGLALRLTELLVERDEEDNEARALLAFFCFESARLNARLTCRQAVLVFKEVERRTWDSILIEEGLHHLARSAEARSLSAYHLQASIAAQHCIAPSLAATNWLALRDLYQALAETDPESEISLNLSIAAYFLDGLDAGLRSLRQLAQDEVLARDALVHATLAEWEHQAGHDAAASSHYARAGQLARSDRELELLEDEATELQAMN